MIMYIDIQFCTVLLRINSCSDKAWNSDYFCVLSINKGPVLPIRIYVTSMSVNKFFPDMEARFENCLFDIEVYE